VPGDRPAASLLHRLRERGVIRVAASYAVIAWLLLQIADVVLEPLGAPAWAMTALIFAAAAGLPIAIALSWFLEIGERGVEFDTAAAGAARPTVQGLRHYADAIVIGVLLIAVVVLLVRQSDIGKPKPPENPAIAVLPFENLSGDPQQEYFSDGLAEEMLDRLGRVPGLRVIARSSSFSFKGRNQDAKSIAGQLGVTTVLEGSVRRDGRRLRLNARLVDGATGQQVWSGSFDRDLQDVFAVQAELAAVVIDAIIPTVRGEMTAMPPPTTELDAHDNYLLGLAAQRSRTVSRLNDSVAFLERAVELDPSYAMAHAALARSLILAAGYSGTSETARVDPRVKQAEQAVFKALSLDPTLSDAHGAYGNLLRLNESPGAEEEYQRALELNPNNAIVAHDYGVLLSMQPGREADIQRLSELALSIDPRSPIVWANRLGHVLNTEGPAAFSEQFDRALEVFAGDPDGLSTLLMSPTVSPLQTYRLNVELQRAGGDASTVLLASLGPLVAVGDYRECLTRIDRIRGENGAAAMDLAPWEIMAAGLSGDSARLDRALATPERDSVAPHFRYVMDAYWLAAQQRDADAADALAKAGDFEGRNGGVFGSALNIGALPAVAHIYRVTGRAHEADELIARFRAQSRKDALPETADPSPNMLLVELAVAAGDRREAVRQLRELMQRLPLPDRFFPELPWYRGLEGEPGYDELVAELRLRRTNFRAEMAALDAAAPGKPD
jgi:serine/threonine-protein kinase